MKLSTLTTLVALTLTVLLVSGTEQAAAAPPPTLTVSLSITNITFPDQDPDFFPVSQQTGLPVQITLTTKNIGTATPYSCSVLARGDLTSGLAIIPVSNIGWTAVTLAADAGESFYSGTLSKTTAVVVAQGSGNENRPSPLQADLTFFIQNLWSYATGNYSQTIDFTITSP
ncbi:MAG: hypothetical protein CXR31_03775 [Geobacter sp.]|nr:MAG: hypothetical protein CXR31_03775 [Geobacter sp.]